MATIHKKSPNLKGIKFAEKKPPTKTMNLFQNAFDDICKWKAFVQRLFFAILFVNIIGNSAFFKNFL